MKKLSTYLSAFLFIAMIGNMSALASSSTPNAAEKNSRTIAAIDKANADGKITYKELKTIATEAKGAKLSFKDKVVLKLFKNKITKSVLAYAGGGKSQMAAMFLCLFLGSFGVHRFYLGYTWQGIVQIITLGGLGVWALIDLIRILTGSLQPKDGSYDKPF
jgi:TM2 domain-containing membrane protein YozV